MVRKKSMEIQTFFGKKVSDSTEYDTIRHSASFALQKKMQKRRNYQLFQISGDSVQNRVFFTSLTFCVECAIMIRMFSLGEDYMLLERFLKRCISNYRTGRRPECEKGIRDMQQCGGNLLQYSVVCPEICHGYAFPLDRYCF